MESTLMNIDFDEFEPEFVSEEKYRKELSEIPSGYESLYPITHAFRNEPQLDKMQVPNGISGIVPDSIIDLTKREPIESSEFSYSHFQFKNDTLSIINESMESRSGSTIGIIPRATYQNYSRRYDLNYSVYYGMCNQFFNPKTDMNKYFKIPNIEHMYYIEDCVNNTELNKDIDYSCSICFRILNNPHKLSCKHSFCYDCIFKIDNDICPLCRKTFHLWYITKDIELSTSIDKLKISCTDCKKNHPINKCENINYKCNKCGTNVMKKDARKHLLSCNIITECIHCKCDVLTNYIEYHTRSCDKRTVTCNKCNVTSPFLSVHRCELIKCKICRGMFSPDKHAQHEFKCEQKMSLKNKKQEWKSRK